MNNRKFYITTAIDYVNSVPHLGTAYEKIGADVIARYKRRQGFDTYFMMGTDEHSLNVERQARLEGLNPVDYCNKMADIFKEVWSKLNLSFDYFIRTTDTKHIESVQHLMDEIYKKGDIYKGWYKGWYCTSCEAFQKEKDLINGNCPVHNSKPQWIEEENYYFRLSKYQDVLLKHIENNPGFMQPEIRKNEIVNVIKSGLEDISISRATVGWGIPVPFDERQVIYVWFDALVNYISGLGYAKNEDNFKKFWPCDLHVIGKDITRFHCVIWPAMLLSAGVTLPHCVFGHGFVYLGSEKMSKTKGTAVDPLELVGEYGADAVRYFLMREVPFDRDGEFTLEKFLNRYRSDLANDLGNLLQRVIKMVHKYNEGAIYNVESGQSHEICDIAVNTKKSYLESMDNYQLSQALTSIWVLVGRANRYVEESSPWTLKKSGDLDKLNTVLYNLAESIRIIAVMIEPFMPETSAKIINQLGIKEYGKKEFFSDISEWGQIKNGHKVSDPEHLFPRIE